MKLTQPMIKYIDSFTVTGFSVQTKNSIEFNERTAKLPNLWHQFNAENLPVNETIFGVYSDYESDADGFYTVTAGMISHQHQHQHQHQMKEQVSKKINPGQYLIFKGKGDMPEAVIDAWKAVWNYFTTNRQYKRSFMTDFEAYGNANEVSIYIGIE